MNGILLDTLLEGHNQNTVVMSTLAVQFTAGDLLSMGENLEQVLREQSVSLVALYADNGPAWVVADLVCQRLDICLVPLPTFFSPLQIRATLARCNAGWLLTDNADALNALVASRLYPEDGKAVLELCRLNCDNGNIPAMPEGTGKITFTSGSTGDAKGVCLSHAQLMQQARALREAVGLDNPRHLCLLPLSTLLENVAGVYAPMLAGGEVIVPSLHELGYEGSRLTNPQQLLNTISKIAPETMILIPELLKLLVASVHSGWQPPESLRFLAVGGSKVGTALLQEAGSLGLPVFEGYGLSECASVVSLNTPNDNQPGRCGKLLPHLSVENRGGELVVSGNAMLGYLNQPESWYQQAIHTGDLGHCDSNGFLRLSGRRKNLLISSYGRNISPEWPESELLANPRLQDVVIFGDAMPYCVALISSRDPRLDDAAIQAWLDQVNTHLPDYAQVRAWHRLTQPLAALPGLLTSNGRPKRDVIAQKFAGELAALYRKTNSSTPASRVTDAMQEKELRL